MGKIKDKIINLPENVMISNVTIYFQNERVKVRKPILVYTNRHYIPLMHFIDKIGGRIFHEMGNLFISYKKEVHSFNANNLIRQVIFHDDDFYITLFDLCYILNLKTKWDYKKNSISLFENKEVMSKQDSGKGDKIALVRLEDITAGQPYDNASNLEKLRIIGDMLKFRGVPFHISWIPRYVNPKEEIDNDLTENNNINNADFIFTLDYLLKKGGVLGLHGYTHQSKDQVSGDGYEFGEGNIENIEEAKARVEKSIETANVLGLSYKYFESPNYSITEDEQCAIEGYFDYIYEPFVGDWEDKPMRSPVNNKTMYIPAPLGYISDENAAEEIIKKIDALEDGFPASFFYHPSKEMEYIGLKRGKRGYPEYIYLDNSPLKLILNHLKNSGYVPKSIEEIEGANM